MRENDSGIVDQIFSVFDAIPEGLIAILVYGLGTLLVLWCWAGIARCLPKTLGGITWIILFAILVTPTVSAGDNASIAPAIFGVLFGVLTKDLPLIWTNLALILTVIGLGCFIGLCWSKYVEKKAVFAKNQHTPL